MRRINRRESFLQQHYNSYKSKGGDHAEYIVWNDLDDNPELCRELRRNYEALRITEKNIEYRGEI